MNNIITTTAELEAACALARQEGILALDTEFVWMRTYRAQLGIVQIGCKAGCWALDCLCGMNVASFAKLIEDPSIVKILHDARQDLMHLKHYTGVVPQNVFDTQLAASFCDFRSGMGLQSLLFEAIDIGLPKTETCTNWMQRPLSAAQVRYALDDVRYLPALREELLKRAEALGTRNWLEEEMTRFDDDACYADSDPLELWKKIKLGRRRLDGSQRAILQAVAAKREELAQKWNLPRAWLGEDGSLVEMAATGKVGKLVHRLKGGQGDTIRALYTATINEALKLGEEDWPEDQHRYYIPEVTESAGKAMEWLNARATELHVAVPTLATRANLTAFVDDVNDLSNPLACGWRYEAVGRDIAEQFGVD